jgi:penicillin V acylase-like amidase (Ntn superfamily)
MQSKKIIALLAFSILSCFQSLQACTEMLMHHNDQYVVGRNFDWPQTESFFMVNPIGEKHLITDFKGKGKALNWTSKYGSVSINYAEKHKPILNAVMGGINQKGLVASILWLNNGKYPQAKTKPVVTSAMWVQYLLDNASTVKQAIALTKKISIQPTIFHGHKATLHLFVADAKGHVAIMEYVHGKLIVDQGKHLSTPVFANNTYAKSLACLKKYKNFGGQLTLPGGYASNARFVRAASFLKRMPKPNSLNQAIAFEFNALADTAEAVGTANATGWSVVYDLAHQKIYYRDVNNPNIRTLSLMQFNFSKDQPIKTLALNNHLSGNVASHFYILNKQEARKY